jgi:hypothetical protein
MIPLLPKIALGAFLAVLMAVVGVSTYVYLGTRQSKVAAPAQLPTAAQPSPNAFRLPGTMILEQDGALFSLSAGRFHQLTGRAGWMQPSFTPGGNVLAVKQTGYYSDVWMLNRFGKKIRQLTNNAAPPRSYDTGDNHWAFYPRMTADGRTIFLSYDSPKFGYEVDLSIWAMPAGGNLRQGKVWTDEYDSPGYTGGDLQPIPVPGGVMFTRYDRTAEGGIISQVWFTSRAGTFGRAVTTPDEDCREPSLSPDGHSLAMICTYQKQVSNLVIAQYSNGRITGRQAVITNQLVAQPTWAPDGSGIAYLAPALAAAPFQLWFIPRAAYVKPSPSPAPSASAGASPVASPSPVPSPSPLVIKPIQITVNNGFDAVSTIAWAN